MPRGLSRGRRAAACLRRHRAGAEPSALPASRRRASRACRPRHHALQGIGPGERPHLDAVACRVWRNYSQAPSAQLERLMQSLDGELQHAGTGHRARRRASSKAISAHRASPWHATTPELGLRQLTRPPARSPPNIPSAPAVCDDPRLLRRPLSRPTRVRAHNAAAVVGWGAPWRGR